ncbi:MAG: SDR family oxidoreductase [Hyphomonas sp.]
MTRILTGRTAFIAGGTSGINLGIAKRLGEAGANVFVVSRNADKVASAVAGLSEMCAAAGASADVRDFESVSSAFQTAHDRFGLIDIVVSGAAGNFLSPAAELSPNGFRTVVEIDLIGSFHVMRAAYEHLRKPGASLINVSAPQGARAVHGQVHACAAKAGVDMLTKCLALEWGREGIRVNSISPGWISGTEGFDRLTGGADAAEALRRKLPMQRFGSLQDIADTALYLASDQSAYVTGTVLNCDGGLMVGSGTLP